MQTMCSNLQLVIILFQIYIIAKNDCFLIWNTYGNRIGGKKYWKIARIVLAVVWCTHLNYFGDSDYQKILKIAPVCFDSKQLLLPWLLQFVENELWLFNQYFLKWIWNSNSSTSYTCSLTPTTSNLIKVEVLWMKHLFTWRPSWFLRPWGRFL